MTVPPLCWIHELRLIRQNDSKTWISQYSLAETNISAIKNYFPDCVESMLRIKNVEWWFKKLTFRQLIMNCHRHKCVEFRLSQMCTIHDDNKSTFLLSRRNGNGVSFSASGRFPNVMNFAVLPSFTIVKSRNRQFFPLWFHTRIARALKPSLIFTT